MIIERADGGLDTAPLSDRAEAKLLAARDAVERRLKRKYPEQASDVEDAVSFAVMQYITKRPQSLLSWLWITAHNRLIHEWRKTDRLLPLLDVHFAPDMTGLIETNTDIEALLRNSRHESVSNGLREVIEVTRNGTGRANHNVPLTGGQKSRVRRFQKRMRIEEGRIHTGATRN